MLLLEEEEEEEEEERLCAHIQQALGDTFMYNFIAFSLVYI